MSALIEPTTSNRTDQVIVVGAGLAGLACAVHLHRRGLPCLVLEASDDVGGRARTDVEQGFLLDRGFQVLLTAYPEAQSMLDLRALELGQFSPGALVRFDGRFHRLADPFRQFSTALRSVANPVGSLADKLRVLKLRRAACAGSLEGIFLRPECSTAEHLHRAGLSPAMVERFFRPFLGGIFLDRDLATSSRMFEFVFRMFSQGTVTIPATGMQSVARQLAALLPDGTVRLSAEVLAVDAGEVVLASGEAVAASSIVVATDGTNAARLLNQRVEEPEWTAVDCLYYAADRAPIEEPVLVLNGDGEGPINNLCVPSQVAAGYSPGQQSLVSVSVLGSVPGVPVEPAVRRQLIDWFGSSVEQWKHLRTYRIRHALPCQPVGWLQPYQRPTSVHEGLFVCGDHIETASIQGALSSGRRAAAAVIDRLQNS